MEENSALVMAALLFRVGSMLYRPGKTWWERTLVLRLLLCRDSSAEIGDGWQRISMSSLELIPSSRSFLPTHIDCGCSMRGFAHRIPVRRLPEAPSDRHPGFCCSQPDCN